MKQIITITLVITTLMLAGCVSSSSRQESMQRANNLTVMVKCPDLRPMVCKPANEPACGIFTDGTTWDYSSGCIACTRRTIAGYIPGTCAGIPAPVNPEDSK